MVNDDAVVGEGYVEETAARRKGDRGLRGERERIGPEEEKGRERRRRRAGQGVLVAGK